MPQCARTTPDIVDPRAATPQTGPVGRRGTPKESAKLAGRLCSGQNPYRTGQAIVADGGFTCV